MLAAQQPRDSIAGGKADAVILGIGTSSDFGPGQAEEALQVLIFSASKTAAAA
ncbi:hypothetical protein [Streptomyces sp. NPDC057636]|uniref:hypothetical protein n=1 Tax=Streptomyces sp. NPDC057636 TaxID=3346189 RepID=UPI0036BC6BFF